MSIDLWTSGEKAIFGLPLRAFGFALLALEAVLLIFWIIQTLRQTHVILQVREVRSWPLFLALLAAASILSIFVVVRFPIQAVVAPGVPQAAQRPLFTVFGGLPWMLAAGFLGIWPAFMVGFVGGVLRGGFETLSVLTPLHFAAQGVVVAWLLRRSYLEWPGKVFRYPLTAGILGGLVFGMLRSLEYYANSGGTFYDGLDYTLASFGSTLLAAMLEGGIAGIIAVYVQRRYRQEWFTPKNLSVGPYNRSLAARLLAVFFGLGVVSSTILVYGDWLLAQSSARDLFEREMQHTASQAGDAIPYFIQSGRAISLQIAQDLAPDLEGESFSAVHLEEPLRTYAFFRQLAVYGPDFELRAIFPLEGLLTDRLPTELAARMDSVLSGIPQETVLKSVQSGSSPQMAFLSPIFTNAAPENQPLGLLIGITELNTNPYLLPVIQNLTSGAGGEAFVVDAEGDILLHQDPTQLLRRFEGDQEIIGEVALDKAPDGSRRLSFQLPVQGYSWHVIVLTPMELVRQLGVRIAANLFGVVVGVGALLLLAVYLISRRLTQPLRLMANAAQSIARGDLDHNVGGTGEDEMGRLAASFEQMRMGLKARIREMTLLLSSSQELATSFELSVALPSILKGVRDITKADYARIVLQDHQVPDGRYESGNDPGNWKSLDEQIVELGKERGAFQLENPTRARAILDFTEIVEPIETISVYPLESEGSFLGVFWLGHVHPRVYDPDEVRLLSILAAQLGVAIANTRLFHRAERERNRLAAVLEATPDAVILIDHNKRISVANPASEIVLHGRPEDAIGKLAQEWLAFKELNDLVFHTEGTHRSTEIEVDQGHVLFASVSDIQPEVGPSPGQVCVLWDITHYKELDVLKTEFVSSVSEDLRAPLKLMRGYATMLTMVGETNTQQEEFVQKILGSVDQMSSLIDNLLDIGRIEAGVGLKLMLADAQDLVEEIIEFASPQASHKQITLSAEYAKGLAEIMIDKTLFRKAISNLIDNAIKFTPAGGSVTVEVTQSDGSQTITVRDTGPGIAPTDQARLFEKFFRAQSKDTQSSEGSGLGLAIVKSIVDQHNGKVNVESKLGEGSAFSIEVPIRQKDR